MLKTKETKSDCVGTFMSQLAEGGLLVKSSTIKASCPATYEASSLFEPSTNSPSLRTT